MPQLEITETPEGDLLIKGMYGPRFGSENDRDAHGEWFDKNTDFGDPRVNTVHAYFDHGLDAQELQKDLKRPEIRQTLKAAGFEYGDEDIPALAKKLSFGKQPLGIAQRDEMTDEALYWNILISKHHRYKNLIQRLADEGILGTSLGSKSWEPDPNDKNRIKLCHISDMTLTVTPADEKSLLQYLVKHVVEEEALEMPTEQVVTPPAPAPVVPAVAEPEVTPPPAEDQELQKMKNKIRDAFEPVKSVPAPTQDDVLAKMLERMESMEKTIGDLNTKLGRVEEILPYLAEETANALKSVVQGEMNKSVLERQTEMRVRQPNGNGSTATPGVGQWPPHAPGGKR